MKQKWIYIHNQMWLNYLLWIHTLYIKFRSSILSSSWVKKLKTYQVFFSGKRAFTFNPCRWILPSSKSCQLLRNAGAVVGCLGRCPWQGMFWWIVSLRSCQEQGTPHNPSNHNCWTWKVVPPCVCTAGPAGWDTWGFMFPCCHGDLQLTLCTAFP